MELKPDHPFYGLLTPTARILKWDEIRKSAAYWKAREAVARLAVFAEMFPGATEGTTNLDLGNGYTLKGVATVNYNLPSKDNSKDVRGVATQIAALTKDTDPTLADRLFRWSAELSITEYKKLDIAAPVSKALSSVLTIKPGLPSIDIVPPKPGAGS